MTHVVVWIYVASPPPRHTKHRQETKRLCFGVYRIQPTLLSVALLPTSRACQRGASISIDIFISERVFPFFNGTTLGTFPPKLTVRYEENASRRSTFSTLMATIAAFILWSHLADDLVAWDDGVAVAELSRHRKGVRSTHAACLHGQKEGVPKKGTQAYIIKANLIKSPRSLHTNKKMLLSPTSRYQRGPAFKTPGARRTRWWLIGCISAYNLILRPQFHFVSILRSVTPKCGNSSHATRSETKEGQRALVFWSGMLKKNN